MRRSTPGEIVSYLIENGFEVSLDDQADRIRILPAPPEKLLERLRPRRDDLKAFLREHQTPTKHRFVLWSGVFDRANAVCLSCGYPVMLHGTDPLSDALELSDPNDAPLISASAIAAVAVAQSVAGRQLGEAQ